MPLILEATVDAENDDCPDTPLKKGANSPKVDVTRESVELFIEEEVKEV